MKNKQAKLLCRIVDREVKWRESLSSVCNLLTSFDIMPTFRVLDVTEADSWTKYDDLLQNDVFTMSYFLSEIYSKQGQAEIFFNHLLRNAKPYSLFLFVDNRSGHARGWFDRLARDHTDLGYLQTIRKEDGYRVLMGRDEKMADLGPYFSKFTKPGQNVTEQSKEEECGLPRLDSTVDFRIYRKV